MSIEVGSKWVNEHGVIVEIIRVTKDAHHTENITCVIYKLPSGNKAILSKIDFLHKYKPYEPVYEYQHAFKGHAIISDTYYTDEEAKSFVAVSQRLDFTKRERK